MRQFSNIEPLQHLVFCMLALPTVCRINLTVNLTPNARWLNLLCSICIGEGSGNTCIGCSIIFFSNCYHLVVGLLVDKETIENHEIKEVLVAN